MTKLEKLLELNDMLLWEMPKYASQVQNFTEDVKSQAELFRSLVNVRPPSKASDNFIELQDSYLKDELEAKGVVKLDLTEKITLWQGDITRLAVDGIVNAANSSMLGCFIPCHGCIDNAIHTFAGVQLRIECNQIMRVQNEPEKTGVAKITKAFNLPSKFILHTVGPIVEDKLTPLLCEQLESSYRSCLELAKENNLKSIAFCCISTGEFRFPNQKAAEIAIKTVTEYTKNSDIKVIFNVFKDEDRLIYEQLLK